MRRLLKIAKWTLIIGVPCFVMLLAYVRQDHRSRLDSESLSIGRANIMEHWRTGQTHGVTFSTFVLLEGTLIFAEIEDIIPLRPNQKSVADGSAQ
jgi:hypothetical protein